MAKKTDYFDILFKVLCVGCGMATSHAFTRLTSMPEWLCWVLGMPCGMLLCGIVVFIVFMTFGLFGLSVAIPLGLLSAKKRHTGKDKPPIETVPRDDGWVKCPNCDLRFSINDDTAFYDNRCSRCRQQLIIIDAPR